MMNPKLETLILSLSLAVSVISLIFAYNANSISKKANEIAERALNSQIAPQIRITKIETDPAKVEVYGGKNIPWSNKITLTDDIFKIIKKTSRSTRMVVINGKEYLLINLCYDDTAKEDIGLVLNAFCYEAEYEGTEIVELSLDKAYSLLTSDTPFEPDIILDVHKSIIGSTITIPVAYACPHFLASSLNLGNIASLSQNTDEVIDLIKQPERAGEIIVFVETAYLIRCETSTNENFWYTLYIKRDMDNEGRIQIARLYSGDEKYKEYCKSATKKAGRNVEVVAESCK